MLILLLNAEIGIKYAEIGGVIIQVLCFKAKKGILNYLLSFYIAPSPWSSLVLYLDLVKDCDSSILDPLCINFMSQHLIQ